MLNFLSAVHSKITPAATYSSTVLTDSPIGFWLYDETSGTTLSDQGSGAKNMTTVNSPTLNVSTGLTGLPKTITFSQPSAQYAKTGQQTTYNLAPSGNWSAECWFSTTNATAQAPFAIRGVNLGGGNGDILAAFFTNITAGKISVYVTNSAGTGYVTLTSTTTVTGGGYFHVAATAVSGGALTLYVNGVSEASTTTARYASSNNRTASGGAQSEGDVNYSNHFSGNVMAPAVYSSTLSSTRVLAHYNAGI